MATFYNAFILYRGEYDEFCTQNRIFHTYSFAEKVCESIVKENDDDPYRYPHVYGIVIVEVNPDDSWRVVGEDVQGCEYRIRNEGPRIIISGEPMRTLV